MSKKRIIVLGIVSLVTVASVSGFIVVMSVSAGSFNAGPGYHGFHKRGMPSFMHKDIGGFFLWKLDKLAEKLALDGVQQDNFDRLKAGLQETVDNALETRHRMRSDIHQELEKEAPDLLVITGAFQHHLGNMTGLMDKNIALFNTFYASLNMEQKQAVTQNIKDRFEYHRRYNSCGKK